MEIPQSQRYQFLRGKQFTRLQEYFLEQYRNKYLAFCNQKFQAVKDFQVKRDKDLEEEQVLQKNFDAYQAA